MMQRARTRPLAAIALGLVFAIGAGRAAGQQGELIDRGREVAASQCSRCHVIDDENRMGGISSTPSFPMMVNFLDDWEERFATFATRNPHPAIVSLDGAPPASGSPTGNVQVTVLSSDIAAIVEYARSLLEETR